MSVRIYNILGATHIKFFQFLTPCLCFFFFAYKIENQDNFTMKQYWKEVVTQRPRGEADNGQENVMERKSNSMIHKAGRFAGKRIVSRVPVKFILVSHSDKNDVI